MPDENKVQALHRGYLQQLKKSQRHVWGYQGILFVLFFAVWEIASRLQWIDPLLFSAPSSVINMLFEKIQDGSLAVHSGITLFETVVSFILGTLLGTILAAALWWSPLLSKVLDPY